MNGVEREESGTAATPGAPFAQPHEESGPPVTALFRQLIGNAATLFRKELAMATSEILHSVQEARAGIGGMVSGAAVLYAGFIFLLLAATLGLGLIVEGWLAALIVGGAVTLIGLIMLQAAKRKLRPERLKPQRTVDSLRKDREMIGRQGA